MSVIVLLFVTSSLLNKNMFMSAVMYEFSCTKRRTYARGTLGLSNT